MWSDCFWTCAICIERRRNKYVCMKNREKLFWKAYYDVDVWTQVLIGGTAMPTAAGIRGVLTAVTSRASSDAPVRCVRWVCMREVHCDRDC